MLSIKKLNKYYKAVNNFHALKDININISDGEFVAILGESGSGKSTLLNCISGLDTFESGEIKIDGVSTHDFKDSEWAIYRNNYVGFIFQEYNLIDHLSIIENVELPLLLQGVNPKIAKDKAIEVCTLLGLKKHLKRKPAKLSGGQQQRVAIARALVTDPKVILADEPTGALDSENAKIILDILKKLSKKHIVILVTHDEESAQNYADRIITLEDGAIISDTDPSLVNNDKLKKLELKRPNMKLKILWKFAKNNLAKRKFRTFFTSITMSIGLVAIFLITFLVNGIRLQVNDLIHDIVPEDQYYVNSEILGANLKDEDLAIVRSMSQVDEAFFQYRIYPLSDEVVTTVVDGEETINIYNNLGPTMIGIPKSEKNFNNSKNLKGNYPKDETEVIVTSKMAEKILDIGNIKDEDLDEIIKVLEGQNLEFERFSSFNDISRNYKVVGVIYSPISEVYVYNSDLETIAENLTEKDVDFYYHSRLKNSSQITVYLNTSKQKELNKLEDKLIENELVLDNPVGTLYDSVNNFFNTVLYVLLGTASISLIVSGILVGLVIYFSVLERVKEIGILTSIGAKKTNIRNMFIFESGVIGFSSSFIALIISILITMLVNKLYNSTIGELVRELNIINQEKLYIFKVDYISVIMVIMISIIYAIICGLIPAIKGSRLNAVEALRKE